MKKKAMRRVRFESGSVISPLFDFRRACPMTGQRILNVLEALDVKTTHPAVVLRYLKAVAKEVDFYRDLMRLGKTPHNRITRRIAKALAFDSPWMDILDEATITKSPKRKKRK